MLSTRLDDFVQLLRELPPPTWNATVTEEPEWKWMQPLSSEWEFGHFAALFIVLGLNDYQTKGKADVGYWPKVVPSIPHRPEPKEPHQLIEVLGPFYSAERFAQNKVRRLKRFARSTLCRRIWASESPAIAADFGRIWRTLAQTMEQEPTKKTIAFAMKCLALALLMVGESEFDFGAIPVPVDSRIRTLSARLGLRGVDEAIERERWEKVLHGIRETSPKATMVHLDSLLWQIGTLSRHEIASHLVSLGAGELASRIAGLFDAGVDVTDQSPVVDHRQRRPAERADLHQQKGELEMGFVVYVNHPTNKAMVHNTACGKYTSRKRDKTLNGFWTAPQPTVQEALKYARSTGKKYVDTCSRCC